MVLTKGGLYVDQSLTRPPCTSKARFNTFSHWLKVHLNKLFPQQEAAHLRPNHLCSFLRYNTENGLHQSARKTAPNTDLMTLIYGMLSLFSVKNLQMSTQDIRFHHIVMTLVWLIIIIETPPPNRVNTNKYKYIHTHTHWVIQYPCKHTVSRSARKTHSHDMR